MLNTTLYPPTHYSPVYLSTRYLSQLNYTCYGVHAPVAKHVYQCPKTLADGQSQCVQDPITATRLNIARWQARGLPTWAAPFCLEVRLEADPRLEPLDSLELADCFPFSIDIAITSGPSRPPASPAKSSSVSSINASRFVPIVSLDRALNVRVGELSASTKTLSIHTSRCCCNSTAMLIRSKIATNGQLGFLAAMQSFSSVTTQLQERSFKELTTQLRRQN